MHRLQPVDRQVRVHLRRRNVGMAQQRLHRAQIGAIAAAADAEQLPARQYVIEADHEDDASGEPVIVAEMDTTIETMSVAEAVMRMDLAELPALMFRSGAHGGLNMIYRRPDGHVGWVGPKALSRT